MENAGTLGLIIEDVRHPEQVRFLTGLGYVQAALILAYTALGPNNIRSAGEQASGRAIVRL